MRVTSQPLIAAYIVGRAADNAGGLSEGLAWPRSIDPYLPRSAMPSYAEPTLLDRARQCEVRRMVCVYCDPAGAVADAKMRERYHAAGAAGAVEPSCGGSTEEHTTK